MIEKQMFVFTRLSEDIAANVAQQSQVTVPGVKTKEIRKGRILGGVQGLGRCWGRFWKAIRGKLHKFMITH